MRKGLAGEPLPDNNDDVEVVRSLPQGHVAAVLGTLGKTGFERMVSAKPCRKPSLVMAMVVLCIIASGSKLTNLTGMRPETAQQTLIEEFKPDDVEPAEFDEALDWLLKRQERIERKPANKHLRDGTLGLYDVSSGYST